MKSVVFALCALVAVTTAQDSANLAACGQTCATNMLSADKADELGCKQNDLRCLCANKNFIYGLRDCSAAICPAEDAKNVVEYGIEICAGAGVAIQTSAAGGHGGASKTGSAAGSATNGQSTIAATSASSLATETAGGSTEGEQASGKVSTIFNTLTSDSKTITTGVATTITSSFSDGGSESNDTDTSDHTSTFATIVTESDGSIHTRTGQTTLPGESGPATLTGSEITASDTGAHQTGSAALTTVTSDGSAVVKTLTTVHKTSESETASVTESVTEPESSSGSDTEATATGTASSRASTTSTSTAAGVPQKTAGPVGIIAAAGLAILML
ncbi:glycoside hydrolase family 18 [Trichoderma cornu-damae]|uniref:Glycoside hydrolase family 18 n=1 Tax=Trichoderma cornu-damae TaxID=654480 RepID=A0A9P8TZP6_9HYPO|nr:glycoside hydrolase family 18 [Trichoderma cornu-damae]